MSSTSLAPAVSSPRLLVTAVGVAMSALSASQLAQAADAGKKKEAVILDATSVVGEAREGGDYQGEAAAAHRKISSGTRSAMAW